MTQQKILDTLDTLMPEVVSTNNPEATLLKFAKKNNLYPTQLEKLGHAFNQCKTLVGLSKQANRGDSFSILDVPSMVEKYATYDPKDVLTKKQKEVHKQVDKITKSANAMVMSYERVPQPDFIEQLKFKNAENYEENYEYELKANSGTFDVTLNKSASEKELSLDEKIELLKEAQQQYKDTRETAGILMQGVHHKIEQTCEKIAEYIRKNASAWSEIVEDAAHKFGADCASTIDTIENYFEVKHIPFSPVDLSKKASTTYIIYDNHKMLDTIKDLTEDIDIYKEAQAHKVDANENVEKLHEQIDHLIKESSQPQGDRSSVTSLLNPLNWGKDKKEEFNPPKLPPRKGTYESLLDFYNQGVKPYGALPGEIKDDIKTIIKTIDDSILIDKKKNKKKRDEEEYRLSYEQNLQKLLLSDPVLSEADPTEVQELFQTIASISPTFAKNDRMMATALKEAIQYGAVPVSMLKDIADFEEKHVKANKLRSDILTDTNIF